MVRGPPCDPHLLDHCEAMLQQKASMPPSQARCLLPSGAFVHQVEQAAGSDEVSVSHLVGFSADLSSMPRQRLSEGSPSTSYVYIYIYICMAAGH